MGANALTDRDDGTVVQLDNEDGWREWVSATNTRNHILGDPILDWLDLYGERAGFKRDPAFPHYDPRTDFTSLILEQGRRFERAVVDLLSKDYATSTISASPEDSPSLPKGKETLAAMCGGVPIICKGVLLDPQHKTYGVPDLLIRSDVLLKMLPGSITELEAERSAPDLPFANWHYRVVDIKFRTLGLLAGGEVDNSGSAPAYKVQLFIYNRALGRLQGFEPPTSYLLGRGWTQHDNRGSSCLERLGPVPQAGTLARKRPISEATGEATDWVRRLRTEGANWQVLPESSVPELYPNASNDEDGPWHHAKKEIAERLKDLTLLWHVAAPGRRMAHEAGIYQWKDPRVTPEALGVTGDRRSLMFTEILDINRATTGPVVRPPRIRAARGEYHKAAALEFYVDFETVSDLADDFLSLPEKGGQPLIFLIGCGHLEAGEWSFRSFVVDRLSEPEEGRIIQEWLTHMDSTGLRVDSGCAPLVIHWSPAEVSNFETAYNSARERHKRPNWPSPRWFDFLRRVIHEEPVVVRGALAFGLKAVAKAMHAHGLIETVWEDGPTDGLGAMVGAWWCQGEARRLGVPMGQIGLMQETRRYNEVDCKVMMEIVRYLRRNH